MTALYITRLLCLTRISGKATRRHNASRARVTLEEGRESSGIPAPLERVLLALVFLALAATRVARVLGLLFQSERLHLVGVLTVLRADLILHNGVVVVIPEQWLQQRVSECLATGELRYMSVGSYSMFCWFIVMLI
jgi:hypothetical protein